MRHGTYPRRSPAGIRIARCPTARETFSLLPDCLASHFPGELTAIEQVVVTVETARSVETAADDLHPEITLAAAVRWIRRRLTPVRVARLTVVTLWPDGFTGEPRLRALRTAWSTSAVLVTLRSRVAPHLSALPTPVGFRPHRRDRDAASRTRPHGMGADRAGPPG